MYNAGFPIPPGYCVTATAFKEFIESSGLSIEIKKLLSNLDVEDSNKLQEVSKTIQDKIMATELPEVLRADILEAYDDMNVNSELFKQLQGSALDIIKAGREHPYVAIRSSATAEDLPDASFAGQQKTFLNIKGPKRVIEAVSGCFASLYTARAIYYREKKGFDHMKVYLSVVVQKQINADVSGVMFTVNPINQNENEIVVEAGFGLGEVVVSGAITPDIYIVSKDSDELKEKKVNNQPWKVALDENLRKTQKKQLTPETAGRQKMSDDKVLELVHIGKKIEDHYGSPQDIEFAMEAGRLYIVQSRPITTLKKPNGMSEKVVEEPKSEEKPTEEQTKEEPVEQSQGNQILKGLAASPGTASGNVKILENAQELDKIEKGDILVTKMTDPDFVPAMERAAAIVTDEGGMTSHAAIVSRELGIPCIVGTLEATNVLKEGQLITVDGESGLVFYGARKVESTESVKEEVVEEKVSSGHSEQSLLTATKVYMNLGEPDKIDDYKNLDFDGIGLMRVEFIVTSEVKAHPKFLIKEGRGNEFTEKLVGGISKVARAINPKPIIVRFSDFKTNEYKNLEGGAEFEKEESNPMLGWRGVSRYVNEDFKDVFKLECEAIKKVRDSGLNNVWVMIPFVRKASEVQPALNIMKECGLSRGESFKIFLMAEVPSMALVPEQFATLPIDGASIGSNDLTQMVLGVDRDSAILGRQGLFDERDIAVKTAIAQIIKGFKKEGKSVSICGQAPSEYPEMVEFLVKHGIDSISVSPDVVHKVREQIAMVERKILLDNAIKKD